MKQGFMFILTATLTILSLDVPALETKANVASSKPEYTLTTEMDLNMRAEAKAYAKKIGHELQLRGTDLYMMGQALASHKEHSACVTDGQKAMEDAKKIYLVGLAMLENEQISPENVDKFVKSWTLK